MALRFDELRAPWVDFGNGIELSFNFEEFTDDATRKKASEDLRETPEVVQASIVKLRQLIQQEKNLKVPLENERYLKRFLRPKKYYPESTFDMMKAFYKMKARENFILDKLSTASIKNALEDRVVQILPKHDQHGRRMLYMEMGAKWNCSKVPSQEVMRATNMLMEAVGQEPRTQLNGIVFIVNFDKLSLSHIRQFPPRFVKAIVDLGQKSSPYRIKGIHIVNNARMFNMLFTVFKPFLGKKWSQRIFLHGGDMESLHKHVDANRLPSFLGGTYELPEYDGAVIMQLLDYYKDKFDEDDSVGYVTEIKES